jgi:hypothetical protein
MTYILESIARLLGSDGQVLTSERILSDQFLSFMFDQWKNAKLDDARLYRMLILLRDSAKLSASSLKTAMRKNLLNNAAAFLTRVNRVKDLDILVANRLLPTILDLMHVLFEVDPIPNVATARQLLLAVRNVFLKLVDHAKDSEKSLRSANHCLQALLHSCEEHKSEIRAPTIVQGLCSLLSVGSEDVLSDTCQSLLELISFSESHFSDFLRNNGMELIKPLLASRGILVRVRAAQVCPQHSFFCTHTYIHTYMHFCNAKLPFSIVWLTHFLYWIGLDWIGLDWIGLDWIGFHSVVLGDLAEVDSGNNRRDAAFPGFIYA